MKLKYCGLVTLDDIDAANEARPDYVGFVFAESRRRIEERDAAVLRARLNDDIVAVGVFRHDETDTIVRIARSGVIDAVQLHGDWTDDELTVVRDRCGKPILRAVAIRSTDDCAYAAKVSRNDAVDYLVLDGPSPGSGVPFDWRTLNARDMMKPYFLAGGITVANLADAMAFGPFAIDVSGGIETHGKKDRTKMMELAERFRNIRKEQS